MPCYNPIQGYRSKSVNDSGKRSIVFNPTQGYRDLPVSVPCGRCTGCRLEYSRQWAIRCVHEASLHENNSFITLTFNQENLPDDGSIQKEHLQKFFKRLRKNTGAKIRYFACGEYGSKNNRPHYHAILFGYDFPDKSLFTKSNGNLLYRSNMLEKTWKYGHSLIGNVTFESCAYVARYVMKKYKGDQESIEEHYKMVNETTGEITSIEPEFCLMSRNPGLGTDWVKQYKSDTDKDFITLRGTKMSLPKFYDTILEKMGEDITTRKGKRAAAIDPLDNTMVRNRIKETVKKAQIQPLERNLEELQ